jgi:hypothetical protein
VGVGPGKEGGPGELLGLSKGVWRKQDITSKEPHAWHTNFSTGTWKPHLILNPLLAAWTHFYPLSFIQLSASVIPVLGSQTPKCILEGQGKGRAGESEKQGTSLIVLGQKTCLSEKPDILF